MEFNELHILVRQLGAVAGWALLLLVTGAAGAPTCLQHMR
jgi:hypothetical protein